MFFFMNYKTILFFVSVLAKSFDNDKKSRELHKNNQFQENQRRISTVIFPEKLNSFETNQFNYFNPGISCNTKL